MILDDEVLAVITAVATIASVLGVAQLIRPEVSESFTAVGLLSEDCRVGGYPNKVLVNTSIKLCIYVYNHVGEAIYYSIKYKLGTDTTLPTNTTPSPAAVLAEWGGVLNHGVGETTLVGVPIPEVGLNNAVLIFELWLYDVGSNSWVYSGRWTHLHVELIRPVG